MVVAFMETGADEVVLVLVEAKAVRGVSGLRAEVTATGSPVFATFLEGRALKERNKGRSQS